MTRTKPLPGAMVRGILESLDSRIAVVDAEGRIVAVNGAWERFDDVRIASGHAPARVGDNYLELLDALARDDRPGTREAANAARRMIARKDAFASVDYQIDGPQGVQWFVARITPMEGTEGGVVVAHEDVTERQLAHQALERAHGRLKALSSKVLSIQEEERRAISRDLHDDVGQSLAALGIALHRLPPGDGSNARALADCAAIVEGAVGKLRAIAHNLRPPQLESLGLADALRWLAEGQARATGVAIACEFERAGEEHAAAPHEIACYRIAQEAINNATRHAKPRTITLRLARTARSLELSVRDDGAGFDLEAERSRALREGSLGLVGMEERAELAGGHVEVRSRPGAGTTVTAKFPLGAA